MRKKYIFGKKLYISILTSIVVLITTIATTFAWVGVFANSTFEQFDIEIKASSLEEYGIEISATGEENTFSDSISSSQIKRQILTNWGYRNVSMLTDESVNSLFSTLNMHQCTNTPILNSNNTIQKLGDFRTIENNITKQYFKFDIYIASTRFYEGNSSSSFLLDVYLNQGLLYSPVKKYDLIGPVPFPNSFVSPLNNLPVGINAITGNDEVPKTIYSSAAASARVAFEKYEVVAKGNPNLYEGKEPISTVIYTGDSYDYPTYDEVNNQYEFGGILPNDSNFAVMYYNYYDFVNAKNGISHVSVPNSIYSIRGVESSTADKTLHSNTNHLIDSENSNEKIGLTNMMKVTVSFWLEGWDADCYSILDRNPITLSLSFGIVNEDIF